MVEKMACFRRLPTDMNPVPELPENLEITDFSQNGRFFKKYREQQKHPDFSYTNKPRPALFMAHITIYRKPKAGLTFEILQIISSPFSTLAFPLSNYAFTNSRFLHFNPSTF